VASKTSCFNKALVKSNLSRFWPLAAFYALIWFVSQPLYIRSHIENGLILGESLAEIQKEAAQGVMQLGFTEGAVLSFGFGGLIAMAVFSYLYSARNSTALHALPIRREEHFISHYLSGLIMLVIPNVVIFLATVIVEAAYGVLDFTSVLEWLAVVTLQNVFFFSFASLCAVVSGHLFALAVFYTVFNVLVVGLEFLVVSTLSMFIYGMGYDRPVMLDAFSPLYRFVLDSSYVDTPEGWRYAVLCAVAGLVFAAIALLLYRKRRVEAAGDVIAFRAIKPVFKYGVAFCAALFFGFVVYLVSFGDNRHAVWPFVACMIVMGSIGYFVAEALLRKSLRVFGRAWKGWICFVAVLVAIGVCLRTDAFGFEKYIPKLEDIDMAVVSDYSRPYMEGNSRSFLMNGSTFIALSEAEKEAVLKLHQSLIDRRGEYRDYDYTHEHYGDDAWHMSITYRMKNGSLVGRSYTFPTSEAILSDKDTPAALYDALMNNPETLPRLYFPEGIAEEHFRNGTVWAEGERTTLSQAQSFALYKAILKDLEAGRIGLKRLAEWKGGEYDVRIELEFNGYFPDWVGSPENEEPYRRTYFANFIVMPGSENTLEMLEGWGMVDRNNLSIIKPGQPLSADVYDELVPGFFEMAAG